MPNRKINKELEFCNHCQLRKSLKFPFNLSSTRALKPLDTIHSDIWGPAPLLSKHGFKNYVVFVDDHTWYTWVYPLKQKNEALSVFIQFKKQVEKLFERSIKVLHTDLATEFKMFHNFTKENGISHIYTYPYTSAQNG